MKGTRAFQDTIKEYLDGMAAKDQPFAEKYGNPVKTLEGCVNYIISEVQKSGMNGFADEEIYSLAVHYYVEESIMDVKPVECQVIVNHQVQLTPEEIEEMRRKAKESVFEQETSRLRSVGKKTVPMAKPVQGEQLLFEFD